MDVHAAPGVAVREFALSSGHGYADYLLFVNGRPVGAVEAKPVGHTLTGVETQSATGITCLPLSYRTQRLGPAERSEPRKSRP